MPITTQVDARNNLRLHRVSGVLRFDELRSALATLYADQRYEPEQNALWDLREADLSDFSTDQVRGIVSLVRSAWAEAGNAKAALVVSETFAFGMARMYEQWLGAQPESRIGLFESFDEALVWLQGIGSNSG